MARNDIAAFDPHQFVSRFYHALDGGDDHKAASFFASNGCWRRKGEALTGPAEIAAALERRDTTRITCHSISNFIATQNSDDHWTTTYYVTVFDNQSQDGFRIVAIMQCEDQIRVDDRGAKISAKASRKLLPSPPPDASRP